jgi:hypothetical protein
MSGGELILKNRDGIRAIAVQVKDYNEAIVACTDEFEKGMLLAEGMAELRKALTPQMMQSILTLQGNALGFKTDKDKDGGYDMDTVRDCTIEAWLRGFYHVNNEFNIIAGRFYGAKAGFERKVKQFPGLTDLDIFKGAPEVAGGNAYVTAAAKWKLNGVEDSITFQKQTLAGGQVIDLRVPVRVNSGMGVDAMLGKADRKIYSSIYNRLTGNRDIIPEGEVGDVIDVHATEKRVHKSSLFDAAPPTEAAGPDPAEQDIIYSEYCEHIAALSSADECTQCAKAAAQDKRLGNDTRKKVMDKLTEHRKQVSQRR